MKNLGGVNFCILWHRIFETMKVVSENIYENRATVYFEKTVPRFILKKRATVYFEKACHGLF